MVTEIRYTSIRRVLDGLLEHPMLQDLTLEQVVRHTVRFISIHGYPRLYQDKMEEVEIHEFRGLLPCDCIKVVQVKDLQLNVCMRHMTDTFGSGFKVQGSRFNHEPLIINHAPDVEPAFKTENRVIFTSFPEGRVLVAYKAIPVDEDGFPLLIDNEVYLGALEAYIKKQVFTVKFDQGKISASVLQNAQTDYAWLAGQLNSEFTIPSISEMESLTRVYTTLIKSPMHFDNGFQNLGDREYLRKH